MVKKVAAKTAGISMDGFKARPSVFDGQTPGAAVPALPVRGDGMTGVAEPARSPDRPDRPRDRPYTGVGSVMSAITREAEVMQELVAVQGQLAVARDHLERVKDAALVMALEPASIRRSRWANRNEAEFATPEFRALKAEIEHAGGNVQPIKVRLLAGADAGEAFDGRTPRYEIVYGHRRHQACLELGIAVNAVVAESMSDQELFAAMDRENRGRKNLSAWEQGRMYADALKSGLFPSLRRLSDVLGVNLSDASRTVQLAKLPSDIVGAFASPLDLQVRWAKPLTDALQKDPDTVLARAKALARKSAGLKPAEVFSRLVAGPETADAPASGASGTVPVKVSLTGGKDGSVRVEIAAGMLPAERRAALLALIEAFVAEGV